MHEKRDHRGLIGGNAPGRNSPWDSPVSFSDPGADETRESRRGFLAASLGATTMLLLSPELVSPSQAASNAPLGAGDTGDLFPSVSLMAGAAQAFLNSLNVEQRNKASFSLEDDQRFDWHYIPRARKGIPFKELDPAQRHLATALLGAGLGQRGFIKAATIMSLEAVLQEIERGSGPVRDPELYFLSLFGQPQTQKPWAWRVEGHHLSLNFTLVDDRGVASTPCFYGANPAEVQQGSRKGLRALMAEEDLARTLLKSLDAPQRTQAIISNSAPTDILSGNARKAQALRPAGIQASSLSPQQSNILMSLLAEYAANMASDIAAARLEKIRSAGFGTTSFAWAGGPERGQPHYYRIQGPTFLIEYDNTQNNANHIHSVWRDFNGDFGLDLLAEHYKRAHR